MTETIRVFDSYQPLRQRLSAARETGQRIALVPTMGNLHEGHLALVRAAREHGDYLLATIFVNPMQFGPNEDYERYPRTFEADVAALQSAECDGVYVPRVEEIYPRGLENQTKISVPVLSGLHCGASRPGHFDGVCTVVCKFFNLLQPSVAVFGLKDYQQFRIISTMVEDLALPVELLGIPTVREASGLAMSSRNQYLSDAERRRAASLYATLQATAAALRSGDTPFTLEAQATARLREAGLEPEYVHICNRHTLLPPASGDRELVILAAARAGTTRLIDNIEVDLPASH